MSTPLDSTPAAPANARKPRAANKPARAPRTGNATAAARSNAPVAMPQAESAAPRALISVPMTVRWADLDAFNHVNNATFLVYAQEARLAWLATIDEVWFDATMLPVVAAVQTHFRRQLPWPNAIVVDLVATRVGTSSVTIGHRIGAATDPTCVYADGEVVMVWINPADGRPVELPAAIRRACQLPGTSLPEPASAATTSK